MYVKIVNIFIEVQTVFPPFRKDAALKNFAILEIVDFLLMNKSTHALDRTPPPSTVYWGQCLGVCVGRTCPNYLSRKFGLAMSFFLQNKRSVLKFLRYVGGIGNFTCFQRDHLTQRCTFVGVLFSGQNLNATLTYLSLRKLHFCFINLLF